MIRKIRNYVRDIFASFRGWSFNLFMIVRLDNMASGKSLELELFKIVWNTIRIGELNQMTRREFTLLGCHTSRLSYALIVCGLTFRITRPGYWEPGAVFISILGRNQRRFPKRLDQRSPAQALIALGPNYVYSLFETRRLPAGLHRDDIDELHRYVCTHSLDCVFKTGIRRSYEIVS